MNHRDNMVNSEENYIQEACGQHSFAQVGFDYVRLNVTIYIYKKFQNAKKFKYR